MKSVIGYVIGFLGTFFALCFIYHSITLILPEKWTRRVITTYTTVPIVNVANQTIDASLASEFSLLLTSNMDVGIIHMEHGRALNLTVTNAEHTLRFTNQISWLPSNTIPYVASNSITVYHFMQVGTNLWGEVMRWNTEPVGKVEYWFDFTGTNNYASNGSSNVFIGKNGIVPGVPLHELKFPTNEVRTVYDSSTGHYWI